MFRFIKHKSLTYIIPKCVKRKKFRDDDFYSILLIYITAILKNKIMIGRVPMCYASIIHAEMIK